MRVLSLFDGISAGRVALERAGIKISCYHASEIDRYAIWIAQKNFTDTVQLGDITKLNFKEGDYDLIIGGSPCQGFSFAGKQLNFEDPRSKLFFEYVRILKEVKPKFFLLENVCMKKEYQDVISKELGVEPVLINSSLVSAQNRKRLYWVNFQISQPEDRNIFLESIIEEGFVDREKSFCLDASYFNGGNPKSYFKKNRRQLVFNYSSSGRRNGIVEGRFTEAKKAFTLTRTGYTNRAMSFVRQINPSKECGGKQPHMQNRVFDIHGKTHALTSAFASRTNVGKIENEELVFRKLTPIECERLQTFPDNYTEGISNTQRYKSLGNSWTVDVIAHIFRGMKC